MSHQDPLPPLSDRMRIAADMVTEGSRVADVGCDHGYVSIWLYLTGRAAACIAMDVNEKPLRAAEKNVRLYGAGNGVSLRRSDGLSALEKGEADCVLITGMGGTLMRRILTEGRQILADVRELVLEPQSEPELVRGFLTENGFRICRETMVCECGKYYPVIRAVPDAQAGPLTETERMYGPCLMKGGSPVFAEYLQKEKRRLTQIAGSLERAEGAAAKERADRIKEQLEQVNEAEQYI